MRDDNNWWMGTRNSGDGINEVEISSVDLEEAPIEARISSVVACFGMDLPVCCDSVSPRLELVEVYEMPSTGTSEVVLSGDGISQY